MVSKGSVPVLYGLSSDEDLTTLHYVACTLVRLGMEEQCHARMIQEGAARYGRADDWYLLRPSYILTISLHRPSKRLD